MEIVDFLKNPKKNIQTLEAKFQKALLIGLQEQEKQVLAKAVAVKRMFLSFQSQARISLRCL